LEIHGNIAGLSASELRGLERLYRRRVPFDRILSPELAAQLSETSQRTGRQVGVLIHRSGSVDFVIVGDATKLVLPDFGRMRAAEGRFRGLRLVHTHLRNEPLTRDDFVDLTRLRLDMVAALIIAPGGHGPRIQYAHCTPEPPDGSPFEGSSRKDSAPAANTQGVTSYGPLPLSQLNCNPAVLIPELEAEFAHVARSRPVVAKDGRAVLIHVCRKGEARDAEEALAELQELARTAGVEVAESIIQVRDQIDPRFVLGRGKLEDVVLLAMQRDCEVLIFNNDLKPNQAAAIASLTDLKVVDRTQLILDIFAQRAQSRDGKLQVELAQMRYLLPRLGQRDDALSRLTGGIGGRGPGETKLEIGRRRARDRITHLERQLRLLGKQRQQRRSHRNRQGVPTVAIVGYTNAGKSTLLNHLTESDVLVEDKLFATLDTRSRRLRFPREREIVITDTVGFIRNLPKDLFAAFRSTFEEAQDAAVLVEVIDISDSAFEERVATTESVLEELKLLHIPRIRVCNKADRLDPERARAIAQGLSGIALSARDRSTFAPLMEKLETLIFHEDQHSSDSFHDAEYTMGSLPSNFE